MKLIAVVALAAALPAAHGADEQGDRTITKVIKLLQGMQVKSQADGERDTELFAKYKCYCDTNQAKKTASIDKANKDIKLLEGQIAELQASSGVLSSENAKLSFDMSDNERARTTAAELRSKANADYSDQKADMEAAITQMDNAIETLSAIGADQTAKASLIADHKFLGKTQDGKVAFKTDVQATLKSAAFFLPQKQQKALAALIQAPFTGTYQAQSGEIVGILKSMRDTFKSNLATAIASEKSSKEQDDEFQKTKTSEFDTMKAASEANEKVLGGNDDALETAKTTKEETETTLASDEDFLAKLMKLCADKTKQYEDRKMIRAGEEAAVSQAVAILNSDTAFDTFGATKAATEGGSFLQLRSRTQRKTGRELVLQGLARAAKKTKSLRLAKVAAMLEAGNPLDKVCMEVEKMTALIAKEQAQDHEQLDWCNAERTESDATKSDKQDQIDSLEQRKTELTDIIENEETGLKAKLAEEQAELADNQKDQADEMSDRKEENAAYQKNVHNLVDAEKILDKATKVLQKFYDWLHAKTGPHHYEKKDGKDSGGSNLKRIPEASVADLEEACSAEPACAGFNSDGYLKSAIADESQWIATGGALYVKTFDAENPVGLLQRSAREDPAPPSEEFSETGSSQGADAVSMLKTIMADTQAETKAAHDSEKAAQADFEDTMTDLKSQEATLLDTIADLSEDLAEKSKSLLETTEELTKTLAEHKAVEKYLLKIKPGCDFITENIDFRDEHRQLEIKALQKAEDGLKATPAYKKAAAEAEKAALGECAEKCPVGEPKNLACKACIAGITESAYCGGHASDPVCS